MSKYIWGTLITSLILVCGTFSFSQNKADKVIFREYKKGYYENSILKGLSDYKDLKEKPDPRLILGVNNSGEKFPTDPKEYKQIWHTPPTSQGITGTCWCFSATAFMESEIKRQSGKEVRLSEMWTVYWEYVERSKDYVKTRGETSFSEGSESNAIPKIWQLYGIVPQKDYPGKPDSQPFHDHSKMIEEMTVYLQGVKTSNMWDEAKVTETIRSILDKYMGAPPAKITINGKEMTPLIYLKDEINLRTNDYFSFMSFKKQPYNCAQELIESDNWWHASNYYNIPLDDYMNLIKTTVEKGYTISLCGDVSEPGMDRFADVAIIPTFDIPSAYIDEDSRAFRLENFSTTDDHCVQIVGSLVKDGKYWFMIKDSGSTGFDGEQQGYIYYSEDYIKLKMMNILIHKDTAKGILDKIIK